MYIGIDLEVKYTAKRAGGKYMSAHLMKQSKQIQEFLKELETVSPNDFIEAQLVHEPTNVDFKIDSLDALRDEVYKYMFWVPEGLAK